MHTTLDSILTDSLCNPTQVKYNRSWSFPHPQMSSRYKVFWAWSRTTENIQNFANCAEPLYRLLRKGAKFGWEDDQVQSFGKLKQMISNPILLVHANFDQPFVIEVDVCDTGIAALLKQDDKIVAMASRILKNAETRWPVREKYIGMAIYRNIL